ncbi:MAG TPA: CopD family protein [Mariprofundaceae bacterium]|nr:CopD family protein [Mariprofundaceae bacterium]
MLWIKSFHIIMMVSWFAGLFYLPRIFVNHAQFPDGPVHERLSLMEAKLYRFVTPIMWLTLLTGLWLVWLQWDFLHDEMWFWLKMAIVALLMVYHLYCGRLVRMFAEGGNTRSHVFYRWFNEAPVFALMGAVILVVVRPF